eukprot:6212768-Pleurochrysis_carterae.AAC.1
MTNVVPVATQGGDHAFLLGPRHIRRFAPIPRPTWALHTFLASKPLRQLAISSYLSDNICDRGRLFSVLTSRPEYYHFDSLARPTVTYKLSARAFALSFANWYSQAQFPKVIAVASHAYLRSAFAPLPRLSDTFARDGCRCPLSYVSMSRPVAAPSSRACARSLTVVSRAVDQLAITRPPRTVA